MSILFAYLELAASIFILLLCFQIFTRHYENKVARFFAMFAMLAFLTAILEYSVRIAFTLELAQGLNRLSGALWGFIFPMFAHFCFIFTKNERPLKSPLFLAFLYLPASVLALLHLFTNSMYLRYEIWPIGIVNSPSPVYWLFFANSTFYGILAIVLLFRFGLSARQSTLRAQALLIAVGSLIPLSIGSVTDEIIPLVMGTRMVVPLCVFSLAFMNFFIYLGMRRYSLFAVSPSMAADVIIRTMPDAMLATDLDGKILFVNEEAEKLFNTREEEMEHREMRSLFKNQEKYDQLYSEVVLKKKEVLRFEAEIVDPLGEYIPSLINANLLRDKIVGDTLGIIFIVRDIRG
jgi:PAS domain S-box-containing protein